MNARTWSRTQLAAGTVVVAVVVYAAAAPWVAPGEWADPNLAAARQAPSWSHWFGTDQLGRDLFVRVAAGVRVSLLVALVCAIVSTVIGVIAGAVAAVAGGVVDAVVMRAADTLNALPHLLLGVVIVALFRGSVVAVIVAISVTHWVTVARLTRAVALSVRSMEYVQAAYIAGASRSQVLRRHLIPAAAPQAAVSVVLLIPHAIWHESALSFLGLGVPPDQASLGTLLDQSRAEVLLGGWWTLAAPAAVLVVMTVAVTVLVNRATTVTRTAEAVTAG